jgi:ribosomal protein S18 acetylase RimI-like enzyme
LVISAAGLAEVDEIASFLQVAYQRAYAGRHAMTAEMFAADAFRRRTAESLTRQLTQTEVVFLTLRDETGAIVATIGLRPGGGGTSIEPAAGEVWGFYVDPGRRHRGYGRTLWSALMTEPRTAGYDELYLHVVNGSADAIAFYRRRGFDMDDTGDTDDSWDWPAWDPPVQTPYRTMRRRARR